MTNPNPKEDGQKQPALPPSVSENETPLQPAGEVVVSHEDSAAPAPPGKNVHRRRPLPPVPDKKEDSPPKDQDR